MNLTKTLSSTAKIRFQHCDPFNHLNNSSYIDYFMNHREDQLIEAYDVDIYKLAQTIGKSWVTSGNQIAYLKPVFLMETVQIESQLITFNDSEIKVEMRMYNKENRQLKAVLWSNFVHFNLVKQKRATHSEDFMNLFSAVHLPLEEAIFETRIQSIKSQIPIS